ncbi:MAG TPA: Rrf2 family transcriptional regulator [Thermoleophilia bacterium]|nr:Rrf2 family transcriptional regulator [Thermoleophilia bacterium]
MLAISTKGRYSLRILILMASQPRGHIFAKWEIAEAEDLSCAYVQQLMGALKTAGFVASHRGKVGGFALARAPEIITVADVVRATEGQTALVPCLGDDRCERESICRARPMWTKAQQLLDDFFSGVTVAELVASGADGY